MDQFAGRQQGQPFNHFDHFPANVVQVPTTSIHQWWKNKCPRDGCKCSNYTTESCPWWNAFLLHFLSAQSCACGRKAWKSLRAFLCKCFLTVKKKKKNKRLKRLPHQPITVLLGSSCLLPWQLPVNIPTEFSHWQRERDILSLQKINWTFLRKIEDVMVLQYLHMWTVHSCKLTPLTLTCNLDQQRLSACGLLQIKMSSLVYKLYFLLGNQFC